MRTYGEEALAVKREAPTGDYRTPRMRARSLNELVNQTVEEIGSQMDGATRAAVVTIRRALRTYVECDDAAAFCAANRHRLNEGEFYFVLNMVE